MFINRTRAGQDGTNPHSTGFRFRLNIKLETPKVIIAPCKVPSDRTHSFVCCSKLPRDTLDSEGPWGKATRRRPWRSSQDPVGLLHKERARCFWGRANGFSVTFFGIYKTRSRMVSYGSFLHKCILINKSKNIQLQSKNVKSCLCYPFILTPSSTWDNQPLLTYYILQSLFLYVHTHSQLS